MIGTREASISKNAIVRYLSDRGWRRKSSRDGKLLMLTLFDGVGVEGSINLIFSNEASEDVVRSEVSSAIETISELYDVNGYHLINSIRALSSDIIFTSIPDEYVRHESIELGLATTYILGMKGLLAASATTEISGESSFKRNLKDALTYAGECRFGHTFHGSFGFVIESPVGMNDAPQLEIVEAELPLGRKVVQRISSGLSSFRDAIELDDPSVIAAEEGGFSANMCDELIGIFEDTGISRFNISISLSPEWTGGSPGEKSKFEIENRHIDILRDASSLMRKTELPSPETIIGRIVRLETNGNPSDLIGDQAGREIWLSWDSASYGLIRVLVALQPQAYLTALEAHKSGQLFSVSGTLRRQGRSWILDHATKPRLIA